MGCSDKYYPPHVLKQMDEDRENRNKFLELGKKFKKIKLSFLTVEQLMSFLNYYYDKQYGISKEIIEMMESVLNTEEDERK